MAPFKAGSWLILLPEHLTSLPQVLGHHVAGGVRGVLAKAATQVSPGTSWNPTAIHFDPDLNLTLPKVMMPNKVHPEGSNYS